MTSQASIEINSTCEKWSEGLSKLKDDIACVDYARRELPNLLQKKELFARILNEVVEGGKYPDIRSASMFDNELLLYADPLRKLSLRLFLWAPGEYTVIHDHNSWGVIGPVSGVLEVLNYKRTDDGSKKGYAELLCSKKLTCMPGETTFTLKLDGGIHNIGNPTNEAMVSLGMYGNPIRRGYIYGFNPEKKSVYKIIAPKVKKRTLAKQALSGLK
ncbi:MAG: cysteine dioxygenase family protein [Thermodesulfobacteriota bacterium]|nr:cysteine dioxygenase family protein [Thermodesulfobacteriota bacterium]